ncbi:MAG TPA: nucleotide-binding domain containing protein, partial [Clostridia bacterium]|nr:nucleotide-binding domain containing protein [Clostridia bacterium]
ALRGNIGSELAAVMDAGDADRMTFIPAYPQMGRITRGGVHYIDGVPVSESVFGSDPFEPVQHSQIGAIIAQQTPKPVVLHPSVQAGCLEAPPGIQLYDAESVEGMMDIAEAVGLGGLRLAAGCAGFAAIMAQQLELTGKTPIIPTLRPALLVVCGSVNPVTQAQLKYAENNGFGRVRLTLTQKLDPQWLKSQNCETEVDRWAAELKTEGRLILDTNDPEGSVETRFYAHLNELSAGQVRMRISAALAALTKKMIGRGLEATLMCTGGDTLLALMQALGVGTLTPVCELEPGVVLSGFTYEGGDYDIITKSGGFGAPTLLCSLADRLSQQAEEREN